MNGYHRIFRNGLTLKASRMSNTHSISIALFLKGGVLDEKPTKRGLTHLVEHLCFRGWRGGTQLDFYRKIERTGGFLRASTRLDHVVFEITVPPSLLEEAAGIIEGLFDEHVWSAQDLRREKEIVLRQIEQEYFPFSKRIAAEYFLGCARTLSIMGAPSHVRRFSMEEVRAWKKLLFQPENACVVLTGNFTDAGLSSFENRFSAIPGGTFQPVSASAPLYLRTPECLIYCGSPQCAHVGLAFHWEPGRFSMTEMDFLRNALAVGLTSPFNLRLREEMGLIEEVDSGFECAKNRGLLFFAFDLDHDCLDLFFHEIGKLFGAAVHGIDSDAFQCTRANLTSPLLLDDPRELAYLLGERTFIGHETFSTAEEYLESNRRISPDRLRETASALDSEHLVAIALTTDEEFDHLERLLRDFRKNLTRAVSQPSSGISEM